MMCCILVRDALGVSWWDVVRTEFETLYRKTALAIHTGRGIRKLNMSDIPVLSSMRAKCLEPRLPQTTDLLAAAAYKR